MANIKFISIIWVAVVQVADFHVAAHRNTSTSGTKDQLLATMEASRVTAPETGAEPYRNILMPRFTTLLQPVHE